MLNTSHNLDARFKEISLKENFYKYKFGRQSLKKEPPPPTYSGYLTENAPLPLMFALKKMPIERLNLILPETYLEKPVEDTETMEASMLDTGENSDTTDTPDMGTDLTEVLNNTEDLSETSENDENTEDASRTFRATSQIQTDEFVNPDEIILYFEQQAEESGNPSNITLPLAVPIDSGNSTTTAPSSATLEQQ